MTYSMRSPQELKTLLNARTFQSTRSILNSWTTDFQSLSRDEVKLLKLEVDAGEGVISLNIIVSGSNLDIFSGNQPHKHTTTLLISCFHRLLLGWIAFRTPWSPLHFLDTMVKHLQSANALRSFSEFRQEASMLHSLQHPCIVSLVGISIHPLCFALQLAPLGSLNTVLEEKHKGKSNVQQFLFSDCPLKIILIPP